MSVFSRKQKTYALSGAERVQVEQMVRQSIVAQTALDTVVLHIAGREGVDLTKCVFDVGKLAFLPRPEQPKA